MSRWSIRLALAATSACGPGPLATSVWVPLEAPAPGEGFQLRLDLKMPPYSEQWKCLVRELPISGPTAAHRVKHSVNGKAHHLTVSLPISVLVTLKPGLHECRELFEQHPQLMEMTSIYGGQGEGAEIALPEGVAAQLPGPLQIVYELHHLNTTSVESTVQSRINVYTMPNEQVKAGIWGMQLRNEVLDIPPRSTKTESARCAFNRDVDLILVATHTHALGRSAELYTFDGAAVGERVYANDDWSQPQIKQYTPPLHVRAGQGFELRCHYDNPTDRHVQYGFKSEDEMCNATFVFTPADQTTKCEKLPR